MLPPALSSPEHAPQNTPGWPAHSDLEAISFDYQVKDLSVELWPERACGTHLHDPGVSASYGTGIGPGTTR
jgi:hypothetical protein